MKFIPPLKSNDGSLYAPITREELDENISKWQDTLVGYILCDRPFYSHLRPCVGRMWKPKCFKGK